MKLTLHLQVILITDDGRKNPRDYQSGARRSTTDTVA